MRSATSVPSPWPDSTVAWPPADAIPPTIASRMPRRSAGTASGSKPGPSSRTNTSTPPADISEHEHPRPAGMAGGVAKCLARGGDQRLAGGVQRPVTDRGELDRDVVLVLDDPDDVAQCRLQRLAQQFGPAAHPGPQRVPLATRQARDRDRVM